MSIIKTYIVPHPPLIIPEVGKGSEEQIKKTINSYKKIAKEIANLQPETIIISSPHAPMYSDYFYLSNSKKISGNLSAFNAPMISFDEDVDIELVDEITKIASKTNFPTGKNAKPTELDHGSIIPLYFIRKYLPKSKIIIVGLSTLPLIYHYQLGTIISQAANNINRKVIYIASGDLSHKLQEYGPYGYSKEGPIYDNKIIDICHSKNFYELLTMKNSFLEKAAECGHRSFIIMAGCLNKKDIESNFLSHEDITGVGYCICSFQPKNIDEKRDFSKKYYTDEKISLTNIRLNYDEYLNLAYQTIKEYILYNTKINPQNNLPSELLNNKAGVFVSIYAHDTLRGCIGTILPTTNCIAEEIINNAISASTKDPRFSAITKEELPWLELSVYILKKPEYISDLKKLNPQKYGVIVTSGYKKGVLLPDLDGIDTIEQQINIAKQKGNINPNEQIKLQRFEVIKHQ